jgi:hypothetical protein
MKKINPEYARPSVSINARLKLIEEGKKQIIVIGQFPIDPKTDRRIYSLIKAESLSARAEGRDTNHIENPRKYEKGMKRYKIYDTYSNEVLAYFYNTKPELDSNYCDLHYVSWHDSKNWYGCKGVNVNPESSVVNFESNSGFANKEDFVKQSGKTIKIKRYTDILIIEDKYPDDPIK